MASLRVMLLSLLFTLLAAAQNTNPENGNVSPENGGPQTAAPVPTSAPTQTVNNAAGAEGSSSSYNITQSGYIAIIVVSVVVGSLGIASAVLFYVAKKRQWEVRKSIKRASKRVVTKMTSRSSLRQSQRPTGMMRMPSPPRAARTADLEKGEAKKPVPKIETRTVERMEVDDSAAKSAKSQQSEKRWKTSMPDSWTVGGRR